MEHKNYIGRPAWHAGIRTQRARVWFYRARSAWDVASIVCGENVTEKEFDAARKLLDSCQRYALAAAAEWEHENSSEKYCNSKYHEQREKQLDARRDRLQTALARYGLRMVNYGLYPSIVDAAGNDKNALHYFN